MARAQLSQEQIDVMRQRLVLLALDIYRREGIDAISLRRLAEMAGISHTLPYRYFESKEALLIALRTECTRAFDRHVHEQEHAKAPPLMRIRSVAAAYIDYVRRWPTDYLLIFAAHPTPLSEYPELLAARQRVVGHGVECVQAAIDAGLLKGDARQLAHMFWMALHGLMTLHVAGQLVHGCSIDDLVEPLVERMLGGDASPASAAAPAKPRAARHRADPNPAPRWPTSEALIAPRRRRPGPRG